jgi:hypothetical protein
MEYRLRRNFARQSIDGLTQLEFHAPGTIKNENAQGEQNDKSQSAFTDWDSSLDFVAGARDAHYRKIDPFLEELLCIPILEDLR